MCGTFAGVEGGNNPLSTYILLELNEDKTRLLKKLLICQQLAAEVNGMPKDVILELRFNDNPVVSDVEIALVGGATQSVSAHISCDITTPMPTSTAARPALRIQSTMRERRARLQTPEPRGFSPTTGTGTSQVLTATALPA